MSNLLPSTHCFLDDDEYGSGYTSEELLKEHPEDYEDQDFNREDYKIIDSFHITNIYGSYAEVLDVRIIRRISDGRYFRMQIHTDSWSSTSYGSCGDYGGIDEVVPREVTKTEYFPLTSSD